MLSLTGAAQAVTDSVFKYSAPKIGNYSISVAEMSAQSYGNVFSIDFFNGRLFGAGCYTTGVHLPQGAKITFLTVYYRGGDNGNLAFYLLRQDFRMAVSTGWCRGSSKIIRARENDSNGVAGQVATVNNNRKDVWLCRLPGRHRRSFEGATVTYTYQTAGDREPPSSNPARRSARCG